MKKMLLPSTRFVIISKNEFCMKPFQYPKIVLAGLKNLTIFYFFTVESYCQEKMSFQFWSQYTLKYV